MSIRITFLGTNGWYATGTGNTVCALVETPDRYLVLDAGDGMHRLDDHVTDPDRPIDLYLSHFHLDHVIGLHILPKLPFRERIRILGQPGTRSVLSRLVGSPFTAALGDIRVEELVEGEPFPSPAPGEDRSDCRVRALALDHSDPCWGFRFEIRDGSGPAKVLAYCTDSGPCHNLVELAAGADVLITECALLPGEEPNPGWPHLSPAAAARMAGQAGARRLILTHFAANKYLTRDARMRAREDAARIHENTTAATDGMTLEF